MSYPYSVEGSIGPWRTIICKDPEARENKVSLKNSLVLEHNVFFRHQEDKAYDYKQKTQLKMDNEDAEFVNYSNGDCSQEVKGRPRLKRDLDTKAKNIYTLLFPTTIHRCESWTVKKDNREKNNSLYI